MVSCQKGPTRHDYAWQIGPFWQDILDVLGVIFLHWQSTSDTSWLQQCSMCPVMSHWMVTQSTIADPESRLHAFIEINFIWTQIDVIQYHFVHWMSKIKGKHTCRIQLHKFNNNLITKHSECWKDMKSQLYFIKLGVCKLQPMTIKFWQQTRLATFVCGISHVSPLGNILNCRNLFSVECIFNPFVFQCSCLLLVAVACYFPLAISYLNSLSSPYIPSCFCFGNFVHSVCTILLSVWPCLDLLAFGSLTPCCLNAVYAITCVMVVYCVAISKEGSWRILHVCGTGPTWFVFC